jgi:hypothetical protein
MADSPGFMFWGPKEEFDSFVRTLHSLNPSVIVDADVEGEMAQCFYNTKKFFLSRHDESMGLPSYLWNVVAAVILVTSGDT